MRFKFVHAADLHLDSPFRAVTGDPTVVSIFQQATLRAFARIVDQCLQERADFLVLAGDLFDLKDRSIRARLVLRQQLERLHVAGIATFIVHGNHDPLDPRSTDPELPPSVKVYGSTWEEVPLVREGQVLCRIQGISYPQERVCENLSRLFRRTGSEFTIGLLHANVGGNTLHANYAPCTLEELSWRELDYWALGHVHTRSEYALQPGGVAVYPGNPQGRHPQETGERGCVVVEVEEGHTVRRFVPMDCVRWHVIELELGSMRRWDELEDALMREIRSRCDQGLKAHVVRVVLTGRGSLHPELQRPGALASIEDQVREVLLALQPPVVLESIQDRTGPKLDLDAIASAGGLAGAIASAARAARVDENVREALYSEAELSQLETALRRSGASFPDEGPELLGIQALDSDTLGRALSRAVSLLQDEVRGED